MLGVYVSAEGGAGVFGTVKMLAWHCYSGDGVAFAVDPGFDLHVGKYIEVRFRFDSGPAFSRLMPSYPERGVVAAFEGEDLLAMALRSQKLIVKVGTGDTMHFDLGTVRAELREFADRCVDYLGAD